ncbi:energy transducer TonB [Pseudoduganella violacea]|uniref:TonB C-terminal domain-containing protein n=1 Tax=Pseudoduganella violacea TaxID=1715466 RepID=A0A7W5B815_9BURK|nr:hypothetical protein [Pseudoduganella violacea]MBB3118121.1 hypothetical protein [Pseudoduganella violacea]
MRIASLMVALIGTLLAASMGALAQERYTLKRDDPPIGSNIKRDAAIGRLPLNKSYGDLTPEQQLIVKAPYASMGEGDEPPFPEKGLASIYKAMHTIHGYIYEDGAIDMEVVVDRDGKPLNVLVYKTPDARASETMALVLMSTKFKPALCGGKPCQQNFLFRAELTHER